MCSTLKRLLPVILALAAGYFGPQARALARIGSESHPCALFFVSDIERLGARFQRVRPSIPLENLTGLVLFRKLALGAVPDSLIKSPEMKVVMDHYMEEYLRNFAQELVYSRAEPRTLNLDLLVKSAMKDFDEALSRYDSSKSRKIQFTSMVESAKNRVRNTIYKGDIESFRKRLEVRVKDLDPNDEKFQRKRTDMFFAEVKNAIPPKEMMLSSDMESVAAEYVQPLVQHYVRAVRQKFRSLSNVIEFDEFMSPGNTQFLKSYRNFDPDRVDTFYTYVKGNVYQAIYSFALSHLDLNSSEYAELTKLRTFRDEYVETHNREPTQKEMAAHISRDVSRVRLLLSRAKFRETSLEATNDLKSSNRRNRIPDQGPRPEQTAEEGLRSEAIQKALDLLEPRTRKFMIEYYFEGLSFQQIADRYKAETGVSISRQRVTELVSGESQKKQYEAFLNALRAYDPRLGTTHEDE
jgi:RNA polymerase sigma factor (sigma-70 family)